MVARAMFRAARAVYQGIASRQLPRLILTLQSFIRLVAAAALFVYAAMLSVYIYVSFS